MKINRILNAAFALSFALLIASCSSTKGAPDSASNKPNPICHYEAKKYGENEIVADHGTSFQCRYDEELNTYSWSQVALRKPEKNNNK